MQIYCRHKITLLFFLLISGIVLTAAMPSYAATTSSSVLDRLQNQLKSTSTTKTKATAPTKATTRTATTAKTTTAADTTQKKPSASVSPFDVATTANEHAAFTNVAKDALPLSPEQIIILKRQLYATQRAAAASPGVPPKPTTTSLMVNLSPGATPPVIRLAKGFVTSLVFVDSTGAPWPIQAYDFGNPKAIDIKWDKKSNTLMVQALKQPESSSSNLAVILRGKNTPIMITLVTDQKDVDYRVDLRIPGYGPKAKQTAIKTHTPPEAVPLLLGVLDGVPPTGSKQLKVSGAAAEAWIYNNKLYLRTRYMVLSPAWIATMTSADGTHAYEMEKTPTILVSAHGKALELNLEGG